MSAAKFILRQPCGCQILKAVAGSQSAAFSSAVPQVDAISALARKRNGQHVGPTAARSYHTTRIAFAGPAERSTSASQMGQAGSDNENETNGSSSDSAGYVSPFASFFRNIEEGRTSSGLPHDGPPMPSLEEYGNAPMLKCGMSENALRFKTTSWGRFYAKPYLNPGEHKVTLVCSLSDIPFQSNLERKIFIQLVGPRYSKKRKAVQLGANLFASRIENKRHVVSMLDRLVLSARTLANEGDV